MINIHSWFFIRMPYIVDKWFEFKHATKNKDKITTAPFHQALKVVFERISDMEIVGPEIREGDKHTPFCRTMFPATQCVHSINGNFTELASFHNHKPSPTGSAYTNPNEDWAPILLPVRSQQTQICSQQLGQHVMPLSRKKSCNATTDLNSSPQCRWSGLPPMVLNVDFRPIITYIYWELLLGINIKAQKNRLEFTLC
jgi:hypothetical protein